MYMRNPLLVLRHLAALTVFLLPVLDSSAAPRPEAMADGYITGVVESAEGPEAGVWVIAETAELKTPFIKIVVTDDDGRFVLPELPEATYSVWVRGYGLSDSIPIEGRPGDRDVQLRAVLAETPAEAAKVYPPNYWYSMFEPPSADQFPGTGPTGNGISPQMQTQKQWMNNLKSACNFCHQLGTEITRQLDHMDHLGFESPEEAWEYRTRLGVRGGNMQAAFLAFGRENAMQVFSDWTTRIADGELPPREAFPWSR